MRRSFVRLGIQARTVRFVVGMALATHVLYGSTVIGAENAVISQFRSEAPQAWNKAKAGILEGFAVDVTETWGSPTAQANGIKAEDRGGLSRVLRLSADGELIQTTYLDYPDTGKKGSRVEAVNQDYGFELLKEQPDDADWHVENLDRRRALANDANGGGLLDASTVFYGLMVEGEWLENLLASDSFEVLSGEMVNGATGSERECKISFRSQHAVDEYNTILGGTLWLLPDRMWVLSRYDVEIQSTTKGRGRASFTYQNLDGYPFLKEWVMDYQFEGDPPIRYHNEFGKVSRCEDDPSAFRLTAFGIPEPASIDAPASVTSRKWRIGITIVGIVLCASALVLRRYARQRAA